MSYKYKFNPITGKLDMVGSRGTPICQETLDTELSSTSGNAVKNSTIKASIDVLSTRISNNRTEIDKKGERVHKLQIGSSGKGSSSKITVSDVVVSPDDGWKIDNARSNALYIVDITSSTYAPDGTAYGGYIGPAILEVIRVESNSTLTSITQQLYSATRNIQERTLNLQRELDKTNSVWGDWHAENTLNNDALLSYTGLIVVDTSDPTNPALWNTSDIDKVYSIANKKYYAFDDASVVPILIVGKDKFYRQTIKFENSGGELANTIGELLWSRDTQVLIVFSTTGYIDGGSSGEDLLHTDIKFYHRRITSGDTNKFVEFQPFNNAL